MMNSFFSRKWQLPLAACFSLALVACSDSDHSDTPPPPIPPPTPEPSLTYDAEIVWTEYGIPHITAQDWGSAGYGYAYAYAQQNYCTVMRDYVRAAGNSARYLGEDGNINDDLVFKLFNDDERVARLLAEGMPEYIATMLEGYAAGLNRYLAETGVDNLAEGEEGCRGAEWVREVDVNDVVRQLHKAILVASAAPLADFTVAAQAPQATAQLARPEAAQQLLASLDKAEVVAAMNMPTPEQMGSNAYAVGEQASQSNSGVLLGNPHFPYQGSQRFYMSHLTVGDEYDVMGGALAGIPAPVIGFSKDVAWSHTVSTGHRFTFYELELNPDNVMQYLYDGEMRDLEARTVSAEQMLDDGTVETVEHTFYFSHYGPIVDLGSVSPLLGGWPNALGTLLTYRDANLDNLRGIDQWIRMGQSADLEAFKENLRTLGIPWVNTIAADRNGDAFYGDISVVPNVSVNQYNSCIRGTLQTLLTDFGFPTMDGSDPDCEWGNDADTPAGIFGYDSLPKLETREYAANANDSYWLSNPRTRLEGFSPLIGEEGIEQSIRTRHTFVQAEQRMAGTDDLGDAGFNVDNIRQMLFGARNHAAELIVEDVISICQNVDDWSVYTADTATVAQACSVLAAWDTRHHTDSVGPHIFYELWKLIRSNDELWAVPFDMADPVNTPNSLNVANSDVVELVAQSLADAVAALDGIPMDRSWGEIQYDEKNGVRHGMHGGSGSMMFSVISSNLEPGVGYDNIRHGNSYMQAVTWDETDCPDAYMILSYSQSTDPANANYADSTELYSNGGWIDAPFCGADRDAQEVRRETVQE